MISTFFTFSPPPGVFLIPSHDFTDSFLFLLQLQKTTFFVDLYNFHAGFKLKQEMKKVVETEANSLTPVAGYA